MSNPTELPDLAESVRKLVKAKGRFHTEQNYKELADALARYDARRDQPEGKAIALLKDAARAWNNEASPDLDATMERIECFLLGSSAQPEGEAQQAVVPWQRRLRQSDATLSPLCGAQHAESGAVAWVYECRQPGDDKDNWAEFFSRNKPSDEPYIRNVRPLYAQLDGSQEGSESNG